VHEPEFLIFQVFVKVLPAISLVPSGMVTSLTKEAWLQGTGVAVGGMGVAVAGMGVGVTMITCWVAVGSGVLG
jgi:hypothetical protein